MAKACKKLALISAELLENPEQKHANRLSRRFGLLVHLLSIWIHSDEFTPMCTEAKFVVKTSPGKRLRENVASKTSPEVFLKANQSEFFLRNFVKV